MAVDWGSVADWVSGLATSGTLASAVWLMRKQERDRTRELADALRTTLDIDDPGKASELQALRMVVTNTGDLSFRNVTVYRKIEIATAEGDEEVQWYVATVPFLGRFTQYEWLLSPAARLATGRAGHPFSMTTFDFAGQRFVRYAGEMPLVLTSKVKRRRDRDVSTFLREARKNLIELDDETVQYSRVDSRSREGYW